MYKIRIFLALMQMHMKKFFKEPAVIFWALIFPIAMSWLLGMAFGTKTSPTCSVGVLASSHSQWPSYFETLVHKKTPVKAKVIFHFFNEAQATTALKRGSILLYLDPKKDPWVYSFDLKNTEAMQAYLLLEQYHQYQPCDSRIIPLSSLGSRYIDFLVPGLMAMGILSSCLWGIGWSLIDLRMKKMLRRMGATPMPKWLFMVSHIVARLFFSGIEMVMLYLFAHGVFGMVMQGSFAGFLVLFFAGNICFSGIAILMAIRADNATVGNGLLNAVMMPMLFLSGIFFSYTNYPGWMHPLIKALPLTLLADGFRHILNEGFLLASILPTAGFLLLYGIVAMALGIKWFKWN